MSSLVAGRGGCERLTRAVDITQHDGGDVDGEDVVTITRVRGIARCPSRATTYASVKKPTPATKHTRTWNHEKGALSISERAALRCSSRSTYLAWTAAALRSFVLLGESFSSDIVQEMERIRAAKRE
jgi:hypothetical protein